MKRRRLGKARASSAEEPVGAAGQAVSQVPPRKKTSSARVLAVRSGESLSPLQWHALERLMSGLTIGDAAKAAGIGRRTLFRWMHEDPHFQAAYNAWQQETVAAARSSLMALTESAIRAVTAALERGDARTAMQLLKGMGALEPPAPGPTNAEQVRKEQQIARKRAETDLFIAEMEAGFPK